MSPALTYEWDEDKRSANIAKHGVDFETVYGFDFDNALTREDVRTDYTEQRLVSIGAINGRLHVMVWCYRGENVRVISLRKANERERNAYDQA